MTVKQLRELLEGHPDEMQVLIPGNAIEGFTGEFFSPCTEDSGEIEMGLEDLTDEEIEERKLLNQEIKTDKSFVLVPCGFYTEHEVHPQLN